MKSLQKLFKGRKAAKSFERSFWDLAYFLNRLGLRRILNES